MHLPEGSSLLDIGSGAGVWCHVAAQYGFHVVAVEPDPTKMKWLTQSVRSNGLVDARLGVLEETIGEDEQFDVISILDVLYLFSTEEQEAILRRVCKHLKPGSRLIIKTMHQFSTMKSQITKFQETMAVKVLKYTHGREVNVMNVDECHRVLMSAGLEVNVSRIDSFYPYPHVVITGDAPRTPGSPHASRSDMAAADL